ncbi:MAG: MFS transporter [Holosporaceae bacterium]|jgi:PAT family beta-lactamase induction signal transducer AmpG|nr:MFS transporter [Holosporaceae bacterium]
MKNNSSLSLMKCFTKCCVGFSYGMPFPLTLVILDFWLKDSGVSNTIVGIFSLLHLPFTFKFLWGPLVENRDIPFLSPKLGRIRSWIVVSHLILIFGIVGMAYSDPSSSLFSLISFASLTSLGDGCKNVVLYPYQIDRAKESQMGYVAGLIGMGHKIGMIFTKTISLHLAHFFSWKTAYLFCAVCIFMLMNMLLFLKIPKNNPNRIENFLSFPDFIKKNIVQPFKNIKKISFLYVLLLYKSLDFMMQKISKLFIMEAGFSKIEIANVAQLLGSISVIIGGLVGGYIIKKISLSRSLVIFGTCHAVSFFPYLFLLYQPNIGVLRWIILFEAFTGGCVTTAFLTFIYNTCRTGSLYAFLWAFHDFTGMFFMGISGFISDKIGWNLYFSLIPSSYIITLIFYTFSRNCYKKTNTLSKKAIS